MFTVHQRMKTIQSMSMIFKELKNDKYLNKIRDAPCAVCYITGEEFKVEVCEAHHEGTSFRFKHYKRKNDYTTIPLCYHHHAARHHSHGLKSFWKSYTKNEFMPFYINIFLMLKFSEDERLPFSTETYKVIEQQNFYNFNEVELRHFIDEMSLSLHHSFLGYDDQNL